MRPASEYHRLSARLLTAALCIAAPATAQEARTIELDGYDVRIVRAGWEHAAQGVPTVVFEGGSTLPAEVWAPVIDLLAGEVPVVAFDPAGLGGSEWDGAVPTPEHMNAKLHRLLRAIDAPPPYVLVGQSWASWFVRAYSGRYPDEVAGLVLIDPTPPRADFAAAFEEIGAGAGAKEEFTEMLLKMSASWPPPVRAQYEVIASYDRRGADPEVPPTPSMAVAVLEAGQAPSAVVPDSLRPSFDLDAFFEALARRLPLIEWVRASPDGTLVFASGSGHAIHTDDPALVAWAILRVLHASRTNQ